MLTPPPARTAGSGSSPSDRGRRRRAKGPQRPLPDPSAVQLRTVPITAPPYDDELLPASAATSASAGSPDRHPPTRDQAGHIRPPRPARQQGPAGRPAFATQFAQVLVESLAGTRPPRQLATWTTERARSRIQRMGPLLAAGHSPQLRRVVAGQPAPNVIEMTIIIAAGPRIKAVAIRLERTPPPRPVPGRPQRPGTWVCTDVEAA